LSHAFGFKKGRPIQNILSQESNLEGSRHVSQDRVQCSLQKDACSQMPGFSRPFMPICICVPVSDCVEIYHLYSLLFFFFLFLSFLLADWLSFLPLCSSLPVYIFSTQAKRKDSRILKFQFQTLGEELELPTWFKHLFGPITSVWVR
jgi:hypothetical protein